MELDSIDKVKRVMKTHPDWFIAEFFKMRRLQSVMCEFMFKTAQEGPPDWRVPDKIRKVLAKFELEQIRAREKKKK